MDRPDKVDCIIEGLAIFKKYGKVDVAAEHDVFYAGPDCATTAISEEDAKRLDDLGWRIDDYGWEIFT